MLGGLIARYDALEYRLHAVLSVAGGSAGAELTVTYAPNLFQTETPLSLSATRNDSGGQYSIAFLGALYTGAFSSDQVDLRVVFEGIRYLRLPDRWRVLWATVTVRAGNATLYTGSNGHLDSYYLAPAGLPFGLARLTATATASVDTQQECPPDPCAACSLSASAEAWAQGGWRVQIGDTWYAYPVETRYAPAPSSNCGLSTDANPSDDIEPSDTYTSRVHAYAYDAYSRTGCEFVECPCPPEYPGIPSIYRKQTTTVRSIVRNGSLWLIPNLPRRWIPLATPQSVLVLRARLPETKTTRALNTAWGQNIHCEYTNCVDSRATETVITPYRDVYLGKYDDDEQSDALLDTPDAPHYWQYGYYENSITSYTPHIPGACEVTREPPDGPPEIVPPDPCECFDSYGFTRSVTAFSSSPSETAPSQMLPYYAHEDNLMRAYNTVHNPHWSHFLWWADWQLGYPLQPVPYMDYWLPFQQQWLGDSNLADSERTRQRNQCLLEPLTVSPYTDWIADTLIGYPTLWAGVCRFDVLASPVQSQRVLTDASAPRWSASNATLTFNSGGIAVSPSAPTHTLEFDLTDWQVPPYLYPVLADSVRIAVSDPNAEVRVYLVDFAGETVLLDPHPSDSTRYPYRASAESIYAGSWAQSYAANLSGYSETGQDLLPAGRSALVMGDNARRTVWEMLGSRTPSKLRIVVSQDSPTDYTLEYPVFYREAPSVSCAYPETAHTQAVVRGEQLWRHGGLEFRLTTPVPDLRPPHTSPTVYDALCLRNLLYHGRAYQDFMTADAMSLYDPEEWALSLAALRMETRALIRPLHTAQNAEPQWVLMNAYREVPPLACLPRRRRNTATLEEDGAWGLWSYILSPIRRYLLNPENYVHLYRVEYDGGGNETSRRQLTTELATVGRYRVSAHALAVNNDEVITDWGGQQVNSPRYLLLLASEPHARMTPFHGYSSVIVPPERREGSVRNPIDATNRLSGIAITRVWKEQLFLELLNYPVASSRLSYPIPQEYDACWKIVCIDRTPLVSVVLTLRVKDATPASFAVACLAIDSADTRVGWEVPLQMNGDSAIVEYWGERNCLHLLYRAPDGRVKTRLSYDYGRSWEPEQECTLDGAPFEGTPHDITVALHQHALYMTALDANNEWVLVSSADGVVWQTVPV